MVYLIDKAALIAEIEKRLADNRKEIERASHKNLEDYFEGYEDGLALLKQQFLDTLEVKEVDLENEIILWTNAIPETRYDDVKRLAEYFYNLGLNTKEE